MAGFDLTRAQAERRDKIGEFAVKVEGHDDFVLSGLVLEAGEKRIAAGDLTGFLKEQMGPDEYDRLATVIDMDSFVRNQMLGAYFEHLGIPSPFDAEGRLKPENQKAIMRMMGESGASAS